MLWWFEWHHRSKKSDNTSPWNCRENTGFCYSLFQVFRLTKRCEQGKQRGGGVGRGVRVLSYLPLPLFLLVLFFRFFFVFPCSMTSCRTPLSERLEQAIFTEEAFPSCIYRSNSLGFLASSLFWTGLLIHNDLERHKHVKTSEIKFRRFGYLMTPLLRNGNKCEFKRS